MKKYIKNKTIILWTISFVMLVSVVYANMTTKIGYSDATSPSGWTELLSSSGQLRTITSQTWEEVAKGNITGHDLVRVSGNHGAIGITELILSEQSVGQQFYLSVADEVVATSDSNEDSAAQTGALTIEINGLTEDVPGTWVRETETLTMAGAPGTATSVKKFIRVDSMTVLTAGSAGSNVGTITFTDQGATGTHMVMGPGHGITRAAIKSIASGKKLLIKNLWATVSGTKSIGIYLYARNYGAAWHLVAEYSLNDSAFDRDIILDSLSGKSDIQIRVKTVVGTAGYATAGFIGCIEDE